MFSKRIQSNTLINAKMISPIKLISTEELAESAIYYDTPELFFANFQDVWSKVERNVLKLETRQTYDETGNKSFDEMVAGNFDNATKLIPETKIDDIKLYSMLKNKKVDFIRCRPVVIPYTDYLKWEFECYKFNSEHGEQIYCINRDELKDIFDTYALHDFMVFDDNIAFIHHYNDQGCLVGGWKIEDPEKINSLISLFEVIKSKSKPFTYFISSLL